MIKEENYTVNKSKNKYVKDGYEVYYNPVNGDTILIREYNRGNMLRQYANSAAVLVEKSKTLTVYKDFSMYSVQEYRNTSITGPQTDFVSVWMSSIEDPDLVRKLDQYHFIEDSLGDPSLLEPANYQTLSQYNYVNNPEFENHPKAPFSIMSFTDQVEYWMQASESPDFYISPHNAHSGSSFIGFRVFSMSKHIEYVQNKLKAPLQKDSVYCFSAYVKLSPASRYATNAFGVQFTNTPNHINTSELLTVKASISLKDQLLCFKTKWMKVQCTYKAKGGEQWLTIGSFQNHKTLAMVEVPGASNESYYYLDDVSLVPVHTAEACPCNFTDRRDSNEINETNNAEYSQLSNLKIGESIILENINFENDKDELLSSSFNSLYNVLSLMHANPGMNVEISGHTSSLGGYDHNMDLSKRRAEAVKLFLNLNGISSDRINTVGHGPKFPIDSDLTEQGQYKNRRVEFKIISL